MHCHCLPKSIHKFQEGVYMKIILTIPETELASSNQWESRSRRVVHYVQLEINLLLLQPPLCLGLLEREITCCPRESWRWCGDAGCNILGHLKDTCGNKVVDCCDSLLKVLYVRLLRETTLNIRIFLNSFFISPMILFLLGEAKLSPCGCQILRWSLSLIHSQVIQPGMPNPACSCLHR